VWDADYSAVWHLNESGSGAVDEYKDSTSNNIDGQGGSGNPANVPIQTSGKIGFGQYFDGYRDYINVSKMDPKNYENFTISAWYKSNASTTSDDQYIFNQLESSTGPGIIVSITEDGGEVDHLRLVINNNTKDVKRYYGTTDVVDQTYHHITMVRYNGQIILYVDGIVELNVPDTHANEIINVDAIKGPYIGDWPIQNECINGTVDEIHFSNDLRSGDWITTEYNNQNDTNSFYTIYDEESIGYQWVELYNNGSLVVDLTDWNLTDNDGNSFNLSGAGSILAGGYLICHLGQVGTNSSTDVYGPPGGMLENIDDLVLYSNSGSIIDYLAWGGHAGTDDDPAVYAGQWTDGDYISTSQISENVTIGRDKYSSDTNSSSDWKNASNLADPFGIHATSATPGAINIDPNPDIVINEILFKPATSGWLYRKKIVVDSNQVIGNLNNFPMLFKITDMDLANKARSDGYDIYFTSSDGSTQLNHEIEYYNSGTGELVAWVNVTSLASSSDTTIYMYYGNSSQSTTMENAEGVWDDNYIMVQHLNETSGTHFDSTQYDYDGTEFIDSPGTQDASGKIDGADEFDGSNDYIIINNLGTLLNNDKNITINLWINTASDIGNWRNPLSFGNGNFRFEMGNPSTNIHVFNSGIEVGIVEALGYNTLETWNYLTFASNDSTWGLYVDGVLIDDGTTDSGLNAGSDLYLGVRYAISDAWKGIIDEVRISNLSRSEAWIQTEYNNQNDTKSFYTVYREELIGYQWVELFNKGNIAINLSAWNLTDNDGNYFLLTGSGFIPPGGYLTCHLGQTGSNSSTDVYGPPGSFLDDIDDLALLDNSGNIIDYVAWGGDVGADDDSAVAVGEWPNGAFVDTSQLLQNETIGRDRNSNDTNTPSDWQNGTTRADPYGVNGSISTPGAQNIDTIIPEFNIIAMPIGLVAILILFINRYYYFNSSSKSSTGAKKKKQKVRIKNIR
jgi:hypothetical protein